jgi:hypothetical protein
LDKGAPNPRYEVQGQPIKNFFGHRDSQARETLSAEGGSDDIKRLRRWKGISEAQGKNSNKKEFADGHNSF